MKYLDISQVLKDTENTLRDFIIGKLSKSMGKDWLYNCGITEDRIEKWKKRKEEESKKQQAGVVEERLLYYADFYDIKKILINRWEQDFKDVFFKRKKLEQYLDILEDLRNPDAHRRELLSHQKHLAIGISGEIRTLIIRYRSKQETTEDFFPRIESVKDNYGNIWTYENDWSMVNTHIVFHPNDKLEFIIKASDPEDMSLKYGCSAGESDLFWQDNNIINLEITKQDISKIYVVKLCIISSRNYHAFPYYDDSVKFAYTVLPSKS